MNKEDVRGYANCLRLDSYIESNYYYIILFPDSLQQGANNFVRTLRRRQTKNQRIMQSLSLPTVS